jgi:hypothetical protein
LDKNSALGDFSKSNTHSKNAQVVISAVVQTSIKHGKSTFFKLFKQENVGNQVTFHLQKSVCDLKFLWRSYG